MPRIATITERTLHSSLMIGRVVWRLLDGTIGVTRCTEAQYWAGTWRPPAIGATHLMGWLQPALQGGDGLPEVGDAFVVDGALYLKTGDDDAFTYSSIPPDSVDRVVIKRSGGFVSFRPGQWSGTVTNPTILRTMEGLTALGGQVTVADDFERREDRVERDSIVRHSSVAVDGINSNSTNFAASLNVSHTIGGGSNRFALAGHALWNRGSGVTLSSITYDGVAMTNWANKVHVTGQNVADARYLVNASLPAAGTYTVTSTPSASTALLMYVISFTNVNQSTPVDTAVTGDAGTPSLNVTSETGDMVVDVVAHFSIVLTAGAGQTVIANIDQPDEELAGSYEAGAATVTMSWSGSGSPAHIAGNINQSVASGAVQPKIRRMAGVEHASHVSRSRNRRVW